MRYEERKNNIRIVISRGEDDFSCLFGNGTQIRYIGLEYHPTNINPFLTGSGRSPTGLPVVANIVSGDTDPSIGLSLTVTLLPLGTLQYMLIGLNIILVKKVK